MMSAAAEVIDMEGAEEKEEELAAVAASFAGKGKGKASASTGGVATGPGAERVAQGRLMLLKNELSLAADCFGEGLDLL